MSRGGDYPKALFEEVYPDLSEGIDDIMPLVRAGQDFDVDAGIFADEELHLMRDRLGQPPKAFIDAPRLARLSEHDQEVALETALWLLQAQGAATWTDGRQQFELMGVYGVMGTLRDEAEAAVTVLVEARDPETKQAAAHRIRADLFLVEDVSDVGLHHFVFRSPERAAAWLAATIDPKRRAEKGGPERRARDGEKLDPHPDQLAASSDTRAVIQYTERGSVDPPIESSFTCYAGSGGVHMLTGAHPGSEVVLRRLGPVDLVAECSTLLYGRAAQT